MFSCSCGNYTHHKHPCAMLKWEQQIQRNEKKRRDDWDNLFICHCHRRISVVNKYDPLHSIFLELSLFLFFWFLFPNKMSSNFFMINASKNTCKHIHSSYSHPFFVDYIPSLLLSHSSESHKKFYDIDQCEFIFQTLTQFFRRQFLISSKNFETKRVRFLAINRKMTVFLQRLQTVFVRSFLNE